MKKLITVIGLLLMSSAAFSADITCKIKISDSSDVGRIEEAKAIVLKEESYTQTLDKNEAAVMFSVTGIKGKGYKAFYVNAYVDENGKITDASVLDEVKNISVPMVVSLNKKFAKLNYTHGGITFEDYEILKIEASCQVK